MDRSNMYPIHTGFLTKSPPETKVTGSFKRWMKRWFVLWEDKTLQYFKDRGDDKPKKTIDLSRCEFLDTNLSDKKFENIFSIRIQSKSEKEDGRTFYLSADSPYEMQTWIEKICNLCDFKALESNNNKSDPKVRIRHQPDVAPLEKPKRDSGIDSGMVIVPDSDASSDQVPDRVVSQETNAAYDVVPSPIPVPKSDVSPLRSPSKQHDSCPLDTSSSESSLSSMKRSSTGSEVYQNCDIPSPQTTYDYPAPKNSYRSSIQTYDIPPSQPTYDYPPNQRTYDVPPSHPCNDSASTQPTYDVPPSQPTYDILPTYSNGKGMDRYSDGSGSGNDSDIYDVPPTYDTLPAPVSLSQTMPGSPYHNRSPQYKNFNTISSRPGGLQFTDYNTLPPSIQDQPAYDTLPPRYDTLPDSNYDFVPAPKPLHGDNADGHRFSPPVNRCDKPQPQITTYVNIGPTDQYKKPLPCVPPEMQRDSGTVLDVEDIYNVPPVPILPGHHAPSVDRSNKPGMSVAPPRVDRGSKPGVKGRDYVNLSSMRSLTVRDGSNLPRREGNLQRSKSAAADFESEGYLYMESPKRTDSSTRYSKTKKDNKLIIPEETDGNEQSEYEFMFSQKAYMNCETPAQTTQKLESSNERNTPLRGKYQEISVVGQCDAPFVPQRAPKTQYTTIDLEKTKGFRKTCEDVGKGQ